MHTNVYGASRQRVLDASASTSNAASARRTHPMPAPSPPSREAPALPKFRATSRAVKKRALPRKKKQRSPVSAVTREINDAIAGLAAIPNPPLLDSVHNCCAPVSFFTWLSALCGAHATNIIGSDIAPAFPLLIPGRTWRLACAQAQIYAYAGFVPLVGDAVAVARLLRITCCGIAAANRKGEADIVTAFYSAMNMRAVSRFAYAVLERWRQMMAVSGSASENVAVCDSAAALDALVQVELDPFRAPCVALPERRMLVTAFCEKGRLENMLDRMGVYFDAIHQPGRPSINMGRSIALILCRHMPLLNTANAVPHLGDELWMRYRAVVYRAFTSFADNKAFWPTLGSCFRVVGKNPNNDQKRMAIAMSAVMVKCPKTCMALFDNKLPLGHLLKGISSHMKKAAADPVAWAAHNRRMDDTPHLFTHLDVIVFALSSRKVQDALLGDDYRKEFLETLEKLLQKTMSFSKADFVNSAVYAARHDFCQRKPPVPGDVEDGEEKINMARAFAFALQVFGRLSTPTFEALLRIRGNESKSTADFFRWFFRLQRSVDRWVPIVRDGKKCREIILTDEDVNLWSCRFEWLRLRICKRTDVKPAPKPKPKVLAMPKIAFPDFKKTELGKVLSTKAQYRPFDYDSENLSFMANHFDGLARDDLARFDPTYSQPARWTKISRNVFVSGSKKLLSKKDIALPDRCSCILKAGKICGEDDCENRGMKIECSLKCHGGSKCLNRRMQKGLTAKVRVVEMKGKGFGLLAEENLAPGTLIGEYCGEILDQTEFKKREKAYEHERHFYFMALTPKLTIDASRMSSVTRFINHSCAPNAEAEKWNSDREPRVAIVATRSIRKGEEITFDYSASARSIKAKPCLCKAPNCRGSLTTAADDAVPVKAGPITPVNRAAEKIASAKKSLLKASRFRDAAKKARSKRDLIFTDDKRIESWKPIAARTFFKIPRKKVVPATPAEKPSAKPSGKPAGKQPGAPMLPQKRKAEGPPMNKFKNRQGLAWQARQSFGLTRQVAPGPKPGRKRGVFQPAPSRKPKKIERGGHFGARKTLTHRDRIARYNPDDSDYSVCSNGKQAKEDQWEYEIPELRELNPFLRDDGFYGDAIPQIDDGKLTSYWAEVQNPFRLDYPNYKKRAEEALKRERDVVEAKRIAHAKAEARAHAEAKARAEAEALEREGPRYEPTLPPGYTKEPPPQQQQPNGYDRGYNQQHNQQQPYQRYDRHPQHPPRQDARHDQRQNTRHDQRPNDRNYAGQHAPTQGGNHHRYGQNNRYQRPANNAPNHAPNHGPNRAPNHPPNRAPNHPPIRAPNHAPNRPAPGYGGGAPPRGNYDRAAANTPASSNQQAYRNAPPPPYDRRSRYDRPRDHSRPRDNSRPRNNSRPRDNSRPHEHPRPHPPHAAPHGVRPHEQPPQHHLRNAQGHGPPRGRDQQQQPYGRGPRGGYPPYGGR